MDDPQPCRCGAARDADPHPCHGQAYRCGGVGIRRFVAYPACLAGAQMKFGAYETWACPTCWAAYQVLRAATEAP